jgi:hypothetical protein
MLVVKLSKAAYESVSVGYRTANGSAQSGSDYVHKNATVTFDPGQLSKTVPVSLLEDAKQEAAETFFVDLHTPNGLTIGLPARATVTIWDNDQSSVVPNGDFEQGPTIWTEYSEKGWKVILDEDHIPASVSPRSGQYLAWLGGDHEEFAYIGQTLAVPTGAPYLSYWHWIESEGACGGYDVAGVVINGSEVADAYDLCGSESTGGWVKHAVDLSNWAGQVVAVWIVASTNSVNLSNLYVDDVSFSGSPAPPAEAVSPDAGTAAPVGKRP